MMHGKLLCVNTGDPPALLVPVVWKRIEYQDGKQ